MSYETFDAPTPLVLTPLPSRLYFAVHPALRCAALRCAALCCAVLCCAVLCCAPCPVQDAVRGEFREVAKLLSDNQGRVHEEGGLVELKDSQLAGVFGYVPQKMFDFDPEWCAAAAAAAVRACVHSYPADDISRGGGPAALGSASCACDDVMLLLMLLPLPTAYAAAGARPPARPQGD